VAIASAQAILLSVQFARISPAFCRPSSSAKKTASLKECPAGRCAISNHESIGIAPTPASNQISILTAIGSLLNSD